MGRDSRQARRARERRQAEARQRATQTGRGFVGMPGRWSVIAGGVVIAIVVIVFGVAAVRQASGGSTTPASAATPGPQLARVIDGVGCNYNEIYTYHQHAHLVLLDHGKNVPVKDNVGFDYNNDCLYWVHSHSPSGGVIHMEAPHKILPVLKTFFDVWGVPITSHEIASMKVKPGDKVKVWVNQKPYSGNPANIVLHPHTNVYIEVGPPFRTPKPYNWNGL